MKIFHILNQYKVEFVIIGGHAVNFHGYIRTTEDVDIIVRPNIKNDEKLLQALKSINACWITNDIDPNTGIEKTQPVTLSFINANHLMMLCTDEGFLDVFDYIPGFPDISVEELFSSSELLDGFSFVSLDWLIKMKKNAERPKDLEDLRNLMR